MTTINFAAPAILMFSLQPGNDTTALKKKPPAMSGDGHVAQRLRSAQRPRRLPGPARRRPRRKRSAAQTHVMKC